MTLNSTFELRKVKGGNKTYKVLQSGKRPTIDVSRAVFLSTSEAKLDETSISDVLDIEKSLGDYISKEYKVVSSITVRRNHDMKKTTIVNVDSSNVMISIGKVYSVQLKCRAVRYIEDMALIIWSVDEAIEDSSLFVDDILEEEEDDDVIEPPVDELLCIRMEALVKLDALMDIRDKLLSCHINDIPIHVKAVNDVV
jgi:hypothetical protein